MGRDGQSVGSIEVITGPMFAGKTEELIRRINRLVYAKKKFMTFKPKIDDRYSEFEIVSHEKKKYEAIPVGSVEEIRANLRDDLDVICIDEVQFFKEEIVELCDELANKGKRVIVAGLDMDFKGEPFKITAMLLGKAEEITKLTAICQICGNEATLSQRLINGKPAKKDDPVIMVGASEAYQARCRRCHKVD